MYHLFWVAMDKGVGMSRKQVWRTISAAFTLGAICAGAYAQDGAPPTPPEAGGPGAAAAGERAKPEFPPFAEVSKDYEKVVSTSDGAESLYTIWRRTKDNQLLAELPRGYANQKHFIAMTVAGGDIWAGLQGGDQVFYWQRYDKTMAMIAPNFDTRTSGDAESKAGVGQQFTDTVMLDLPVVTTGPGGQPVIDLDALLVGQAGKFFAGQAAGANPRLATIQNVRAFPDNVEVTIQMPVGGGQLRTFHYSISRLPETTGYKPREADERVGYFTTSYRDLGKYRDDQKWVRYINRWHIEKREPGLRLSPPKKPIVFYVENTVPVRYRRYVRNGVEYWNKAFEKIGILNAIEVEYQDQSTGAHMDKDPEDTRYNFIRWLSNDMGTAIGPSRTDPRTGQILDADVVLTDGWIRHFWFQANQLLPEMAMQGFSPETLAFLDRNPDWDPRIRLANPGDRDYLLAMRSQRGVLRYGGHPAGSVDTALYGDDEFDGLAGRTSQFNGMCLAARGKGFDMAMMRMHMELELLADESEQPPPPPPSAPGDEPEAGDKDAPKKDDKPKKEEPELLDGIPEWFVGPMLTDLVAHEVGHTLGLRHNFKASSIYKLNDINSDAIKGKKPFTGSVMDYTPVNINREAGPIQGDYTMIDLGPYDFWVIDYGYGSDPKKALTRVSEPELVYLTDEDLGGPDPLARQYDFSADPLDYATNQMRLVKYYRERLLAKFVKDGESWSKARRGYNLTLNQQLQAINMMAPWVGGAHVSRDRKGDPGGRPPIQVVPAQTQRAALKFVIDNAFADEAFGLTPEMLKYMTVDKWWDGGGRSEIMEDATWAVHDRILGAQASAITMVMNPTVLRRVYDNEFRVPADQDMLTLPELMNSIAGAIWTEIESTPASGYTNRKPYISSLRRNLQREYLDRLIDLSMPGTVRGAAGKPISNLATAKLRDIRERIKRVVDSDAASRVDDYSKAHLAEAGLRIDKVLDASYIYNADKIGGGGGGGRFFFGQPAPAAQPAVAPGIGASEPNYYDIHSEIPPR